MAGSPDLAPWLSCQTTASPNGRYRHGLMKEASVHRKEVFPRLKVFVETVHNEAKDYWRNLITPSLDPLQQSNSRDPSVGYPAQLPMKTWQGYFGEIMAGVYAEHHAPHGISGWEVPTYPLILHEHAFNMLEKRRQTGASLTVVPGQSGDDCLAFLRDQNGRIIRCLVCESKCTTSHRSSLITEAHDNLSEKVLRPVSLAKLVQILKDRKDPQAQQWVEAIRQFYMSEPKSDEERYDLVMYVCGQPPQQSPTWISCQSPHGSYHGGRKLEAVEMHISNVENLLHALYDEKT